MLPGKTPKHRDRIFLHIRYTTRTHKIDLNCPLFTDCTYHRSFGEQLTVCTKQDQEREHIIQSSIMHTECRGVRYSVGCSSSSMERNSIDNIAGIACCREKC